MRLSEWMELQDEVRAFPALHTTYADTTNVVPDEDVICGSSANRNLWPERDPLWPPIHRPDHPEKLRDRRVECSLLYSAMRRLQQKTVRWASPSGGSGENSSDFVDMGLCDVPELRTYVPMLFVSI